MALYKTSLRMATDATFARRFKWSTTFFFEAVSSTAAAAAMVAGWVAYLRNGARTTVFAYEAYATSVAENDDDYQIQTIPAGQQRGTLAAGGGQPYWPEVCLSVTLPTLLGGRPSRKFWRPGLYEGDVDDGVNVSPTLVVAIQAAFQEFITESGGALVDPDGQEIAPFDPTVRLTRRAIGREAGFNLPVPPPVG